MIILRKDENGRIIAVCEWLTLNDGKLAEDGELVLICELEIVKEFRGNGMMRSIYLEIYKLNPNIKYVAWGRHYKYPGRGIKLLDAKQIKRRITWAEQAG